MAERFFSDARRTTTAKKKIRTKASGESIKDDDWMYKPYGLSRATRVDKDQEYTKIEGDI